MSLTAADQASFRERALRHLRQALGDDSASFRESQLEAVEAVVTRKEKLLLVQRTGWGKSIVYFLATKFLRESGQGPTLLVSPLLSLMRNQKDAAARLGIVAEFINSTNKRRWPEILTRLEGDQIDVLLISPERLADENFQTNVLLRVISSVGLFVVDEAHCISDWGHDFRPDYLRIARIMRDLPPNTPVLATTATANHRVVEDIVSQLGEDLKVIRGPLVRHSLRLQNISMPSPAERMAWLAEQLPKLPGSGIVYTLTIRDAQRLACWLQHKGIDAHAYHANLNNNEREKLERSLLDNKLKALVATVALGMGFDKPDLGFVVHFQRPASVVHYYQQVGRAGRAVESAFGVLLGGSEDDDIADYFIEEAFPPRAHVASVVQVLEKAPNGLTESQLLSEINLEQQQLKKVLTILLVQSPSPIVNQEDRYRRTATAFDLDSEKIEQLIKIRKEEQRRMQEYLQTTACLMEFVSRELDDPHATRCGMCANCVGAPLLPTYSDSILVMEAVTFLRRSEIVVEPRKQWPTDMPDERYRGRIPGNRRAERGRALCMWGDVGWGDLVRRGKQLDGRFADDLVNAAREMLCERWQPAPFPTWVTCVPSANHPTLVSDYARRLADALEIPFKPCVRKVRETQPQKEMRNSIQQLGNIIGAFAIDSELLMPGPVLLVDDIVDSRWTFTVVAALLRASGSGEVFPLALAQA